MDVYEKSDLNTVRRHPERAKYDKEIVAAIIRESKILHVAFTDEDEMPQCMPMIGALEENEQGDHILYLHAHPSSRIFKRLNQPDIRIAATGTILDGYVLALSSFGSSMNYRSAVLHGFTSPIGNNQEDKTEAFAQITERTIPGRWDHARKPTPAEYKGTAVIRVIVDSASVKIRSGPPVEDKKDLADTELASKVWTGVVPVHKVTGPPQPTDYSMQGPLPSHVAQL
ncbi:hypothetical protein PILCRDRAFT_3910 [Piloderma croceum F 1598]|uniref:Pyridoxamine 5'-phosphate oxidase putative domain-containing protein n=1 Tax=Piloderma croceum (strain F 1598) TaxID=765440 RepID=A0A0C3G6J2_PILCF|nr:hypothetical protein PILCRDRAFT_3910 [Piloderma croceum F 1598]